MELLQSTHITRIKLAVKKFKQHPNTNIKQHAVTNKDKKFECNTYYINI